MRIGDLLKLRIDCIKPHLISGYTIEWTQHKGRKDKAPMPVRSECVAAIEKLIEITAELRDEADEKDKNTLMIWRVPVGKGAGTIKPFCRVIMRNGLINSSKITTSKMPMAIITTLQVISLDELLEQICFPKELT